MPQFPAAAKPGGEERSTSPLATATVVLVATATPEPMRDTQQPVKTVVPAVVPTPADSCAAGAGVTNGANGTTELVQPPPPPLRRARAANA